MGAEKKRIEKTDLTQLTDQELITRYRQGNDIAAETLMDRYKNLVKARVRGYFLIGADPEDIIQEGMIGLYKAIRDYRDDRRVSFQAFAEVCIIRQVITAVKTATRQKHIPLNSYISLSKPVYEDDSERTLVDIVCEDADSDPEKVVIDKENFAKIERDIGKLLSKFEWKVLTLYLQGRTYQEIADALNKELKSIDNALQRIKKKLTSKLGER